MNRKVITKFALIFLVSFLFSFSIQRFFNIGFSDLKAFVESYGTLSPLVYSLTLFFGLSVPFNPVPDFLVVNLAALLFSPAVAVLATFAGHFLALSVNYGLARLLGEKVLKKLSGQEYHEIEKLSKKINLGLIFGLRFFLPITAIGIDVVSYAAGVAKLDFGKFLVASLVPWTIYSLFFFFSTSFLKGINAFLFFLPAVLILGVPVLFLVLRRKENLWEKIKRLLGR